jgi:hypothetical protein
VYLPEERTVTLNLSGSLGVFTTEWFDPDSGKFSEGPVVEGGGKVSFTSPKEKSHILLHIKSKQ